MRIDISGVSELRRALERKNRGIDQTLKSVVNTNTRRLERKAKENAHFGKYSRGNLRRSINMSFSDNGLTGEVSPHTDYASYVEYGTSKMTAQPYMRPAYNEVREQFVDDMEQLVK